MVYGPKLKLVSANKTLGIVHQCKYTGSLLQQVRLLRATFLRVNKIQLVCFIILQMKHNPAVRRR